MENNYSSWSASDVEKLTSMMGNMTCTEMGVALGRSRYSIKNKIRDLSNNRTPRKFSTPRVAEKPAPKRILTPRESIARGPALRQKPVVREETEIEWCPQCHSPVSNWQEHFQRLGHRRPM